MESTANELRSVSSTISEDIVVQLLDIKRQSVCEKTSSTGRSERLAPDLRNPTAIVDNQSCRPFG